MKRQGKWAGPQEIVEADQVTGIVGKEEWRH
jgi:hypothetical protein